MLRSNSIAVGLRNKQIEQLHENQKAEVSLKSGMRILAAQQKQSKNKTQEKVQVSSEKSKKEKKRELKVKDKNKNYCVEETEQRNKIKDKETGVKRVKFSNSESTEIDYAEKYEFDLGRSLSQHRQCKRKEEKTLLEKYFSSPIPNILKRMWSSISGKPLSTQTSSQELKSQESDATVKSNSSSLLKKSTTSTHSISSFLPWGTREYSESPKIYEEEQQYKQKLRNNKQKFKFSILQLEDLESGNQLDFHLFEDQDLPFLKKECEANQIIINNIIDGDMDDDCQTDQEQISDSKEMLQNDLAKAINQYNEEKKDGTVNNFIKNLNGKRFQRTPFY